MAGYSLEGKKWFAFLVILRRTLKDHQVQMVMVTSRAQQRKRTRTAYGFEVEDMAIEKYRKRIRF